MKEALQYLVGLGKLDQIKLDDGRLYTDKSAVPVKADIVSPVDVETLCGFVDLLGCDVGAYKSQQTAILVESFETVKLISLLADIWGRRQIFVVASCPKSTGLRFGSWYDPETFVIVLQSCFAPTPGREYLTRLASSLSAEGKVQIEDDGITQRVTVKRGVQLKGEEEVASRVSLAPFRTFREITQPSSDFVFRFKSGSEGELPTCALFEADGGAWRIQAVQLIASWLRNSLGDSGIPIVA